MKGASWSWLRWERMVELLNGDHAGLASRIARYKKVPCRYRGFFGIHVKLPMLAVKESTDLEP